VFADNFYVQVFADNFYLGHMP